MDDLYSIEEDKRKETLVSGKDSKRKQVEVKGRMGEKRLSRFCRGLREGLARGSEEMPA